MVLNRYRLRHLAEQKHAGARRALSLLERPDRLISFILLGNNFVNIVATQITTVVTLQLFGEDGLVIATLILTPVLLIFGEVVPKTYAALHPENIAYPSSLVLKPLMAICAPFTFALNYISTGVLQLFNIAPNVIGSEPLGREELRTVVKEAGALIPHKHQQMLFGILDLEKATVEDIMVPRSEVVAIDLEDEWSDVVAQLVTCRHTRVPCFRGNLDNLVGILHMRNLTRLLRTGDEFKCAELEAILMEPYFVPLKTDLHTQLINFQVQRQRIAMVVDEYGDIEGLVTIDDLLEEVVGEFTTVPLFNSRDVYPQQDGSFLIDGSANIRELNRNYGWSLPEDGPKTLNGLILEALEDIPEPGTSLRVGGYTIEIVHSAGHAVRNARVFPPNVPAAPATPGSAGAGDNSTQV